MKTKNPFLFPGFSASAKLGERNLNEYSVRYARVFKDKEGKDRFAYKLNLFYMYLYYLEFLQFYFLLQNLENFYLIR